MAYQRTRVELNRAGIAKWLAAQRSNPKMNDKLRYEGSKLARAAGKGFTVRTMDQRQNRPGVVVYASTREAKAAQARENRLGKALGGLTK